MRISVAFAIAALLVTSTSAQSPKSQFITSSDGLKIHYLELGTSGTPVILIHGYTANAEGKWVKSGIAQALAARHRVIAIDARGHGKSDKPHDPAKYGPRMAADVIELMDHLKIAKAHVHGYSMGGSILTQILAKHPDRLTTAIYGGSGPQETDAKWIAQVPKDAERAGRQRSEGAARRELVVVSRLRSRRARCGPEVLMAARRSGDRSPKGQGAGAGARGQPRPAERSHASDQARSERRTDHRVAGRDARFGAPEPCLHVDPGEIHRRPRSVTIYFAGSIRGGHGDQVVYEEIIDRLRRYGTVLTEHVGDVNLSLGGENAADGDIHDRDLDWLRSADVLVAEVTTPSLGVGYEIGRAVEWGKRVICLYRPS